MPTHSTASARSAIHWYFVLVALLLSSVAGPAAATDYNIDYPGTTDLCGKTYGGAALALCSTPTATACLPVTPEGTTGDNGTPYWIGPAIYKPTIPPAAPAGLDPSFALCSATGRTFVSWACSDQAKCQTVPCFTDDTFVHLGVSVKEMDTTLKAAYVYNDVNVTNGACMKAANVSDATCGALDECGIHPTPAVAAAQALGEYACLGVSPTGIGVHTDGKTLRIISGSDDPACACKGPSFVGKVRFEYYAQRQPLSSLNRSAFREPFHVDSVAGGRLECGDTLVVVNDAVPAGARYLVAEVRVDSVETVDSPRAIRAWVQEIILASNEHVITASAGPHGRIDPSGQQVVLDGGSQTFSITPDGGFHVGDVRVDGVSVGPVATYTFSNVKENHTIEASFVTVLDCQHAIANPPVLWPPDHKLVTVKLDGIRDADGHPVMARITGITQDESETFGGGPSAIIDSPGVCRLRAERNGDGNGRVYTISFTADDGHGGACDGSVQVCVPHDRKRFACVDDGPLVSALDPSATETPVGRKAGRIGRLQIGDTLLKGGSARVSFSLPAAGEARLSVYDIAGRRVALVVRDLLPEGSHEATWNIGVLARGIYFYRLQAGPEVVSRPLLIPR